MPGLYSRIKTWITNEVLTHTDLNAEFDNVKTNFIPTMLDDYSQDVTQMRIQTTPGAQGSESLATATSGELERLRYVINRITGGTYWYDAPANSISTINTNVNNITPIPANRITTGRKRTTPSAFPIYLQPSVTVTSVTLKADASTNLFTYFIAGTQYTLSADVTLAGLSTAPSSNNTATLSANITTTQSEIPSNVSITIGSVGTEISNLVGKYAAFKLAGSTTEYFIARVATATTLSDCRRGFFFDSADAPIPRTAAVTTNVVTLMKLSYIFVSTTGTLDVCYNQPFYLYDTPTGASTGDFWFDLGNSIWKKFNGSSWAASNSTLIGLCIQDTTKTVAARSFDLYKPFSSLNTVSGYKDTANIVLSNAVGQSISVNGASFTKDFARWSWDMSTDLDSGVTDSNNVKYYLYVTSTGDTVISNVPPYDRRTDLLGFYHPYQMWRCVCEISNDGSAAFDGTTLYNYTEPFNYKRTNGALIANDLNIALADGGTTFSTSSTSFVDVTGLSVSLACKGNPVMFMLTGDPTYAGYQIQFAGAAGRGFSVKVLRDSTIVLYSQWLTPAAGNINFSNLLGGLDFPGVGTFTYKVQLLVSNGADSAVLDHLRLVAWEVK